MWVSQASKSRTVKQQECNSIKQIDQAKVLQSRIHLSLECHKEIEPQPLITTDPLELLSQEPMGYLFKPQLFITLEIIWSI